MRARSSSSLTVHALALGRALDDQRLVDELVDHLLGEPEPLGHLGGEVRWRDIRS